VTIPKRIAKMLVDLAARDIDKDLFAKVCDSIYKCLDHTERNTGRIYAYILKQLKEVTNTEYKTCVIESLLGALPSSMVTELTKEIPDANK